jgi:hypothetical protein
MGPEFKFPSDGVQLWISSVIKPEEVKTGRFNFPLVARMKPGVTTEQLADELTALARGMPERFGGSPDLRAHHREAPRRGAAARAADIRRRVAPALGAGRARSAWCC